MTTDDATISVSVRQLGNLSTLLIRMTTHVIRIARVSKRSNERAGTILKVLEGKIPEMDIATLSALRAQIELSNNLSDEMTEACDQVTLDFQALMGILDGLLAVTDQK